VFCVSAVDVTKLLLCAEGLRNRNVLVLVAATGMRRGEALVLHWSDVDLDGGVLVVRGTLGRVEGKLVISEPKTRSVSSIGADRRAARD
jgi:integrase